MATTIGDVTPVRHCDDCETTFRPDKNPHRHCGECGTGFNPRESPREQHCTDECFYADRGEGALNQLASDHRLCNTCFKYVKSTHRPSTDFLEEAASKEQNAIDAGGEYADQDGTVVLDVTEARTKRHPGIETDHGYCYIGMQYPTTHTRYLHGSSGKWVCECGNVDLGHHNDLLARVDYGETVACLLSRLGEFFEKGAIQESPTESVFYEWLEKDDYGLETAVGAALHE